MDIPKKVHVGLLTRHSADRFHFNGQRCLIPAARPPFHRIGARRTNPRQEAITVECNNYVEKSSKRWAFPNPTELIPSLD